MLHPLIFTCVDPALSRLDYELLSDQARMEIFVSGLNAESKTNITDAHSMLIDVCDWPAVTCDAERNVIVIKCYRQGTANAGSVLFDFLPPKVTHVAASMRSVTGTIETRLLPKGLTIFDVSDNSFYGTIDFSQIPRNVIEFRIPSNDFRGRCDFAHLPPQLQSLEIADNAFFGSILLIALPETLIDFDAGNNDFSGK